VAATSGSPARPSELDAAAEAAVASVLARCGCRLRRISTSQTINDNSNTTVSFDTEDEDTDGFWAIGTPTVITIPTGKSGIYAISFTPDILAVLSAGARGFVDLNITSALTGLLAQYRVAIDALGDRGLNTWVGPLLAGDTFNVSVLADMAAGSTMTGYLTCYRVGL
jgi:hypothetical protein